jgi:hypothetical protein
MAWDEIRDLHVEFLTEQGFRPEIDEGGDVHFRYEGRHFYIMEAEEDTFFHLLLPSFYPLTGETDVRNAALAASAASRVMKVAKVFLNSTLDDVSASVELLVAEPTDVHDHLLVCVEILAAARAEFVKQMTALQEATEEPAASA